MNRFNLNKVLSSLFKHLTSKDTEPECRIRTKLCTEYCSQIRSASLTGINIKQSQDSPFTFI